MLAAWRRARAWEPLDELATDGLADAALAPMGTNPATPPPPPPPPPRPRNAWEEIVGRCEEVGVDAFEINFSCPHGMPERRMGMAVGQDPDLLSQVRPARGEGAGARREG